MGTPRDPRDPPRDPKKAIASLPENATEPDAPPRATEEEGGRGPAKASVPPAGSHDTPDLTNPDSTPGAGTLPPPGPHDDTDSTSS